MSNCTNGKQLWQAIANGDLLLVRSFVERGDLQIDTLEAVYWSARTGHLDIVQYWVDQYVIDAGFGEVEWEKMAWNINFAARIALESGHLNVFFYLIKRSGHNVLKNCNEKEIFSTFQSPAVKRGYLDVLKYLVENWNTGISSSCVQRSITHGQLEILRYLVEKIRRDHLWEDEILEDRVAYALYLASATENPKLSIFQYLFEDSGLCIDVTQDGNQILRNAVKHCHIDIYCYIAEVVYGIEAPAEDATDEEVQQVVEECCRLDRDRIDEIRSLRERLREMRAKTALNEQEWSKDFRRILVASGKHWAEIEAHLKLKTLTWQVLQNITKGQYSTAKKFKHTSLI